MSRAKVESLLNPTGERIIAFSNSILHPEHPEGDTVWSRVTVTDTAAFREEVVEDMAELPACGFYPALGRDYLWSPDGRYLFVIFVALQPDGTWARETGFAILDVLSCDCVDFHHGDLFATNDNLHGWHPDEPHTLLLFGERGELLPAGPAYEVIRD